MKVSKLVYVTLLTRVVVEEGANEQTIMEEAIPKLSESLMDSPFENIEKIVDDTDCPYHLGEEFGLSIGDNVDMPEPSDFLGDMWQHEFTGYIKNIYESNNVIYASVEDGDGDCFDIEAERIMN